MFHRLKATMRVVGPILVLTAIALAGQAAQRWR
jgi:hypothetical protein